MSKTWNVSRAVEPGAGKVVGVKVMTPVDASIVAVPFGPVAVSVAPPLAFTKPKLSPPAPEATVGVSTAPEAPAVWEGYAYGVPASIVKLALAVVVAPSASVSTTVNVSVPEPRGVSGV